MVISSAGTYIVSGELTDGQLLVDAGDDDKVQLVLAGATIHNEDGPAIYVRNVTSASSPWTRGRRTACPMGRRIRWKMIPDEPYATLFSRCDLTLNGDGTLNVISAYRHAVCSKDDLVVVSGTYNISAVEMACAAAQREGSRRGFSPFRLAATASSRTRTTIRRRVS